MADWPSMGHTQQVLLLSLPIILHTTPHARRGKLTTGATLQHMNCPDIYQLNPLPLLDTPSHIDRLTV